MSTRIMSRAFATALLAGSLLAGLPAQASVERARAAQARGDLRAAQIELRNAVRNNPNDANARALLAQASLDLADGDTAEKEARAAMERGFDRAAGTSLLLRAYLMQGKQDQLLRDFPAPTATAPDPVAGQVAAGRSFALQALNRREDAKEMAELAMRLAPNAVEPNLAMSAVAIFAGDRAAAEAGVDRALAADPNHVESLLRKGTMQFERGDAVGATETFTKVLARMPGNLSARLRRGEAQMRQDKDDAARQDVAAALRQSPNSPQANYLNAMLLGRARDWKGTDEALQRVGAQLPNFPDGLLLLAATKQALGQAEQAEDAARRHYARRPDDARGAKLLAAMELGSNRPDAAAGTLSRLAQRGAADAEALDMLGRALLLTGRRAEGIQAFAQAVEKAPDNAGMQARLAAARFSGGDTVGALEAGRRALALDANSQGAREVVAAALVVEGDLQAAAQQLAQLPDRGRETEVAGILDATIKLLRLDMDGARAAFDDVIRRHPNSVRARLGAARVAAQQDRIEDAERLLTEVLQLEPTNSDAANRLAATAVSGAPRAATARAILDAAQAANPAEPALAYVVANVALRTGNAARAVALLDAPAIKERRRSVPILLLLAEAHAAQNQWAEAEAALRLAVAEDPESGMARRQLSAVLTRTGNNQAAESVLTEGLRARPGDALLQMSLIEQARAARGLDAALELADRLGRSASSRPASLSLRGDLLFSANRPEEAARAYAAGYAVAPSSLLAIRQALAWQAANKRDEAATALAAWIERSPQDANALALLAQLDLAAGRNAEAEQRLNIVTAAAPQDGVSLNNLAWLLAARGDRTTPERTATLTRARELAERAYYLQPSAETADTLGWILVKAGEPARGVPLLRRAMAAQAGQPQPDPGMTYRLASALAGAGQRDEARALLQPLLAANPAFPDRDAARRLLTELGG